MTRKGLLDTAVPRLKQYMAENNELLTCRKIAEFLGVSSSTAYGALLYMEAMGTIQHVKRGRTNLYFLRDAYDESYIATMNSSSRATRRPNRKSVNPGERTLRSIPEGPVIGYHPRAPGDMLPALAILGIHQTESSKPYKQLQESKPHKYAGKQVGTPLFITVERYGLVRSLPKEARHLSMSDTAYLKEEYLSGLDGYEDIERFDCFFSEMPALRRGEYGNVLYASMGTNPWEKIYKVTVEHARARA